MFSMAWNFKRLALVIAAIVLLSIVMLKVDINYTIFSSRGIGDCKLRRKDENKVLSSSPVTSNTSSAAVDFGGSPWCPKAFCPNSDLCHPCRRRFLILIATGRSASTTLTYMLDALPGIRMSGENNDELKAIRSMIDNIGSSINFQRNAGQKTAWGHNRIPEGAFSCAAQHMIETINPPLTDTNGTILENDSETIVGFKTIRFLIGVKEEDTRDLVRWVQKTFPCARILVNIRSAAQEQAASVDKAFGYHEDIESLKETNVRMRKVAELFGDQAYLLDSSDWLKEIQHLNQAIKWLGFHESCFFKELLEFNTEGGGYENGKTKLTLNPDCRYLG